MQKIAYLKKTQKIMPQKIHSLEFHSRQSLDYMTTSSNALILGISRGCHTPKQLVASQDLLSSVIYARLPHLHRFGKTRHPRIFLDSLSLPLTPRTFVETKAVRMLA